MRKEILIVNPDTMTRCAADEVGEIWVAGPSVAQGYWKRPDATEHTFRAHLADVSAERARRIGSIIRTMRLEANLTRLQLAAKIGVAQETVARLETGQLEPTIDVIEHLALALGRRLQNFA